MKPNIPVHYQKGEHITEGSLPTYNPLPLPPPPKFLFYFIWTTIVLQEKIIPPPPHNFNF